MGSCWPSQASDQGRPARIRPTPLADVLLPLAPAFSAPTFPRFAPLALAALLTTGRRTAANLLRTLGGLAPGQRTSSQRLRASARWSGLALACCLGRLVLRRRPPGRPVVPVGDDTVDGPKGQRVSGQARHRDPVRSTHSYTAWRCGHRRVVPAVLDRSEDDNRRRGRPHRTPAQPLGRLVALRRRWFPPRRSVRVGHHAWRWTIETTFREARAPLGRETTRGWCRLTVRRAGPGLLGRYSVVALRFATRPEGERRGSVQWPGQAVVRSSDALTAVRRWLGSSWVFPQAAGGTAFQELPEPLPALRFSALAPAA